MPQELVQGHDQEHATATGRVRHRILEAAAASHPGAVVVAGQLQSQLEFERWVLVSGRREYVRDVESIFNGTRIERPIFVASPANASELHQPLTLEDLEALPSDVRARLQEPRVAYWASPDKPDQLTFDRVDVSWQLYELEGDSAGKTLGFGQVTAKSDGSFQIELSMPYVEAVLENDTPQRELHIRAADHTLVVPIPRELFVKAERDLHG